VAGLADHINDGPVVLPPLKMRNIQFCSFFPAQPAAQENAEKSPISLAFERAGIGHLPERLCLIGGEPVAQTNTEVLRPLNTPDAGGKILAEQARISCLVREPPDGREPAVNRARRKLTGFQMNAIPGDDRFVEGKSGFGAVPAYELVNRVSVSSLRFPLRQTIENCRFGLIKVW